MVKQMQVRVLGIVENMSGFVCPKCGEKVDIFGKGGGQKAGTDLGVTFLGSIPIDANITVDGDKGLPFVVQNANSEAARAFTQIVDNIREQIEPGYKG